MRSRATLWFEVKIAYEKTMEDGLQKKVKETYVVDALSFTEGESRSTEQMKDYISGEFTVDDMKKAPYSEIFFDDDNDAADKWYKVKVNYITIDENTEKEKRTPVYYLIQAESLKKAIINIEKQFDGTMIDFEIVAANETPIMDVFEYKKNEKEEE